MTAEQLQQKYLALSNRERLLILASVLVISYMLISALLLGPLDQGQKNIQEQLDQIDADLLSQQSLQQVYRQAMNSDPDAVKKRQLDALQQQLLSLDESLTRLSVGLVPAAQLPQLLQDVLQPSNSLRLLKVETLPIAEMSLQEGVVTDAAPAVETQDEALGFEPEPPTAGVFKHSVKVTLEGQYFQLVKYIQALEGLSWRLFWEQLNYQVTDYPTAKVEFVVYTLSTEEGLFSAQSR